MIRSDPTGDSLDALHSINASHEFEMELANGVNLSQTYKCPLGNREIKLATTYRKSEAAMFRPVIEYAWQSLKAK